MSVFLVMLIIILALMLVIAVMAIVFIQLVKQKEKKIKSQFQNIEYLDNELLKANRFIKQANLMMQFQEEGKKNEDKVNNTSDSNYDPNGMFDRFKRQ